MENTEQNLTRSENWSEMEILASENPKDKLLSGFPFSVPFPKMYSGKTYEIITANGEKFSAIVDDSREFTSEGLEWKTIGENHDGNKEQSNVAAWRLIEEPPSLRVMSRRFSRFLNDRSYCSQCGGVCSNSKHASGW